MATHAQARDWAIQGFKSIFGVEPTLLQRQWLQVVALAESQYGAGWKGEGVGSWNMGAVQAGKPPCNPSTSFLYTDTHPNADGTSTPYSICFRKYPGPVEGMADVARILFKQMKIEASSIRDLSTQMYEKHYYEGFGATKEIRINNHVKYLTNWMTKMVTALGEPMPPVEGGTGTENPKAPTTPGDSPGGLPSVAPVYFLALSSSPSAHAVLSMHQGDKDSELVLMVQASLKEKGLYKGKLDGDYGPLTEAAVRKLLAR